MKWILPTALLAALASGCATVDDTPRRSSPAASAPARTPGSSVMTEAGTLFRCRSGNVTVDYKITRDDIGVSPPNQFNWTPRYCNRGERARGQGSIGTVCAFGPGRIASTTILTQPWGPSVTEETLTYTEVDQLRIETATSWSNGKNTSSSGTCHAIDAQGRRIERAK